MTAEETTRAILTRVEDTVGEIRRDVKEMSATIQTKADASALASLEARVRVLENEDNVSRGAQLYRTGFPRWASVVLSTAALITSIAVAVRLFVK